MGVGAVRGVQGGGRVPGQGAQGGQGAAHGVGHGVSVIRILGLEVGLHGEHSVPVPGVVRVVWVPVLDAGVPVPAQLPGVIPLGGVRGVVLEVWGGLAPLLDAAHRNLAAVERNREGGGGLGRLAAALCHGRVGVLSGYHSRVRP